MRLLPNHRSLILALAATALAAGPLLGQTAAQRHGLELFRDSLGAIDDSVRLRSMEKAYITQARQPSLYAPRTGIDSLLAAHIHVRLGFIGLRLGDLGNRPSYDAAASEFQWAIDLAPSWPYSWFGLGMAELGVGDASNSVVRGFQTMLGKDALTRAANDFARSAEVDSSFVEGLVELSTTALRQRINARMDVALAALRRAARSPASRNPEILLARGRVEREVGDLDSSLVALSTLLEEEPGNAMAMLELARTRFSAGRLDGGDPWYRGLAIATGPALAEYRQDLSYVMPDSDLKVFDADSPAERVAMVRHFWDLRDRLDLHRPGERLREHYRRLDYAIRNFRLVTKNRQYSIEERYRSTQSEFDDRGVIWIRHGAPDERVPYNAPGVEPNESWLYKRETGDLIFHFVARQDVQDYRLVPSVLQVAGFATAVQVEGNPDIQSGTPISTFALSINGRASGQTTDSLLQLMSNRQLGTLQEAMFRSREGLSPIYDQILTAGRGSRSQLIAEERTQGERSIKIGTTTDSWPLRFHSDLKARVQILAVGADSAGPQLQVALAIPGDALNPVRLSPQAVAYPIRVRASALSLNGDVVAVMDTSPSLVVPAPVPAREFLLKRLALHVPPGVFVVKVSVETQDNAGMVTGSDTVRVASPLGPSLGLSDLALGTRAVHLVLPTAGADTAWFNPLTSFHAAEPMQLFFQVTGLRPQSTYHVELEVDRPKGGSIFSHLPLIGSHGAAIKQSFDQRANGSLQPVHQQIGLERLKPGTYVLVVTVSDESGGKVTRKREFTVSK